MIKKIFNYFLWIFKIGWKKTKTEWVGMDCWVSYVNKKTGEVKKAWYPDVK